MLLKEFVGNIFNVINYYLNIKSLFVCEFISEICNDVII